VLPVTVSLDENESMGDRRCALAVAAMQAQLLGLPIRQGKQLSIQTVESAVDRP
jgi:hypothetical protein